MSVFTTCRVKMGRDEFVTLTKTAFRQLIAAKRTYQQVADNDVGTMLTMRRSQSEAAKLAGLL